MKPVKLPGLFPNTWRYVFGEFTFHKKKGSKKPTYRCTYKRAHENCNVTITKEGGKYIQRPPKHNHPAPPNSKLKQSLEKNLENLANTCHLSSNEIIDVLCERDYHAYSFYAILHRSEALYSALLKGLVERIPSMKQNLKSIFCDFEPSFIAAVKKSFDDVKLQRTWFNYIRVTSRLWRTLNLKENLKHDILRYSWLIPLLPPNRFEKASNEIIATIQDTNEIYDESEEDLISFIRCLKGLIGSKPESISYYNNHENAINVTENVNRHIANNFGGYNPNLFTYLGNRVGGQNDKKGQIFEPSHVLNVIETEDSNKQSVITCTIVAQTSVSNVTIILRYSAHRKSSISKEVLGKGPSPACLWIFSHEKITKCCLIHMLQCSKGFNKFAQSILLVTEKPDGKTEKEGN